MKNPKGFCFFFNSKTCYGVFVLGTGQLSFLSPTKLSWVGSLVQTRSGVCWCGWQVQVPEGSGHFWKVIEGSGAGPGRRFRKVLQASGVCRRGWQVRFLKVSEGSGGFGKLPEGSAVGATTEAYFCFEIDIVINLFLFCFAFWFSEASLRSIRCCWTS